MPTSPFVPDLSTRAMRTAKRVAVFASFSSDGFLPPQVAPFLAGLEPLTSAIVVVCDNELPEVEQAKLRAITPHVIVGRHGEYDFGSYKRGLAYAEDAGLLEDADDLVLCNDSCFGPVGSFAPMFQAMDARQLDVWGATDSHEYTYHLQSYWIVLRRNVFSSSVFRSFLQGVVQKDTVREVVLAYELGLTECLMEAGFSVGAFVSNTLTGVHPKDPSYKNLTAFPIYTLKQGLPLVKAKALRKATTNAEGQNRLLAWLAANAPDVYETAIQDIEIKKFEDADDVAFSLIMPTLNRGWCIAAAIKAALAQTHRNFELIIVDDGSTDDTGTLIARTFAQELADGLIKYIRLPENLGVSAARNIGLAHARNPWIAYADSDNIMRPYFLTMMANAIVAHRECDALYARIVKIGSGATVGQPFARDKLLQQNFTDIGAFVHRKSLVALYGGFDPDLRRLVDWDLIIRYTAHQAPVYVPHVALEYEDKRLDDRITMRESFAAAAVAIHSKHRIRPTVTTAILSYNHQEFLVEAVESALAQTGDYTHEILISDDGSTDGTARIAEHYSRTYPKRIRNISRTSNSGISQNYKHCFREAAGDCIAILEGDDYWTDDLKNQKQVDFLMSEPHAAMVFSRVHLLETMNHTRRLLERQSGLERLLTGADFAASPHLNLIANFSSAMFRTKIMRDMPTAVYQPRLNEISVAFYIDRLAKIGFLNDPMSVYRLNPDSVWTGASKRSQLEQAIAIRQTAMQIAQPSHRFAIKSSLDRKIEELAALTKEDAA